MDRDPSCREATTTTAEDADFQTVLHAWHEATVQSQQAQDSLHADVARLSEELKQREREFDRHQSALGTAAIVARAGDELRAKLAPMSLHLSLLRRHVLDDPIALDLLHKVEGSCSAFEATANDLCQLSIDREPELRPVHLRALIEEVHASVLGQLSAQGVATVLDVADRVTVWADVAMLRRALLQLTLNALDAMPSGGELVVTSYSGPSAVELEIADSGAGLSDEALRHAFEPFYTTKNAGTGLGLAVVKRLVELHGGDVFAANCPEGGAAFTMRFPRRAMRAAA